MTLRELTENLDVNTPLYIGLVDSEKVVFEREHAYDVIPENLLNMEVGAFCSSYNRLYIRLYMHVKRNSRKGSFRELIDRIGEYECIDVYVVNCDGAKEKVYSNRTVFAISDEFDNYLVKRVNLHGSECGSKIEIVIEPREEEELGECGSK